ncbi:hypothetical protein HD554DRAFT_2123484 [Boletus coccyginus]|nr:hypothetical protein HD554DRAFT_2123484 [Boletus coccyginus]
MVLLIKNKLASFEDVAHLSVSPAGGTPAGPLAKLRLQSLRSAGVPKAKSLPHINLSAEGGSLKAHCTAVLNADLHRLKPRELIARKVKSAKEDLRQLFDDASVKQRVEPASNPSGSVSTEPPRSTTPSNASNFSSLGSPSPLPIAPSDEQDEEDEDHIHRLTAVAQGGRGMTFARLSFDRSRIPRLLLPRSRYLGLFDLIDSSPFHPICAFAGYSPTPSATTLANQTTVAFRVVSEKPAQSPEFSDEELQREFDQFSFHSSQDEEWTSETESRKQNAMNRALSDMKRKLAVPVPRLSSYFSDDSLADSAAQQTLVDPPALCSGVVSQETDDGSIYSADQEDEGEEDDKSVSSSGSPPDSLVYTPTLDGNVLPTYPAELSLSCQMNDPTLNETQDSPGPRATDGEDGTDNVWEVLAAYVPRKLLTRISEESLADEYEIEATAEPPPSFRRPIFPYRKNLWFRRQCTSLLDHMDQVDSKSATRLTGGTVSPDAATSSVEISFATAVDTDSNSCSSSVVNSGKTLRRVRKFVDLKNPAILPMVESTSSIETMCETISLYEEACPPDSPARRLRRVPGCLDLRKAFGRTDVSLESPLSISTVSTHSLQTFGSRFSFEESQSSSDLEEGRETQSLSSRRPPRTGADSTKPPIPPKPLGFHLHRERIQLSSATTKEPSSLCSRCDPVPSLPLWSCAKITRSMGKRRRLSGESTKALRRRLDSIHIDPETIHGHPSSLVTRPSSDLDSGFYRSRERFLFIPFLNQCRKAKPSNTKKLEKTKSRKRS